MQAVKAGKVVGCIEKGIAIHGETFPAILKRFYACLQIKQQNQNRAAQPSISTLPGCRLSTNGIL